MSSDRKNQGETFHAVGPGKQFPPVLQFRGKPEVLASKHRSNVSIQEEEPIAMASSQSLEISNVDESATSWKLYDVAASILKERRKQAIHAVTASQKPSLVLASQFVNLDTIRRNIARNDVKVDMVHFAFSQAARAVLYAIQGPTEEAAVLPPASWSDDLPQQLLSTYSVSTSLASLRSQCMKRSFENKEYAKRKGGKTDDIKPSSRPLKAKNKISLKSADAVLSMSVDKLTTSEGGKVDPESVSSMDPSSQLDVSIREPRDGSVIEPVSGTKSGRSSLSNVVHNQTRALLCIAGTIIFEKLTPSFGLSTPDASNQDLLAEAKSLAHRCISIVENVGRRIKLRYQYRKENARYDLKENDCFMMCHENPFSFSNQSDDPQPLDIVEMVRNIPYRPNPKSLTKDWQNWCASHFISILDSAAGHGIYMDLQWSTRHGRLTNLLELFVHRNAEENFGPHLIVTTEDEIVPFAQEFYEYNCSQRLNQQNDKNTLYALTYRGSKRERLRLRKSFSRANGLPSAAFHVLITSYDSFFEDYLHFCQLPFDTVILDGGAAWLAAKEHNSTLGIVWDSALFSTNDHHAGLAGTSGKAWDFSMDEIPESVGKEAFIGLTTRHRIVTTQNLAISGQQGPELFPILNLLTFIIPQFMDLVKEEWERSKLSFDTSSMNHFRSLLAGYVVVHCDAFDTEHMRARALNALQGKLGSCVHSEGTVVPVMFTDDDFVSTGKVSSSHKSMLQWLGPPSISWLRYALGSTDFHQILDEMKLSNYSGHFCEEITPASTLTSSGANGQISGTSAFRLAVRCGRHFGSELGLRQHIAAQHAPGGSWLCRTCSCDCVTSQARTFHEKTCGKPVNGTLSERTGSSPSGLNIGSGTVKKGPNFKSKVSRSGAMNPKSDKKDADSTSVLGEGDIDGAKALSVINIKDLPPDVKPLLRDPRQTSRTGGNSKRHIYAYRGVCRQARKGHDRWQSQISFMGVNHYLGTFDSEWDAAAIYAWAHLLLYGEEATKLAQKEGEEAAAAYEQEKKDIAAGKLPEPIVKSEKKKKPKTKGSSEDGNELDTSKRKTLVAKTQSKAASREKNLEDPDVETSGENHEDDTTTRKKKGKRSMSQDTGANKRARLASKGSGLEKEALASVLAKGVVKVPFLAPRFDFLHMSDPDLIGIVSRKLKLSRTVGDASPVEESARPCIPLGARARPCGVAILVGLSASAVDWDLQDFFEQQQLHSQSEQDSMAALQLLAVEYDEDSVNEKFQSLLQGTYCTIGCAEKLTQEMYRALGLGSVPLGGCVGNLDCHIGGVPGSCSELAACIQYSTNDTGQFHLSCLSSRDIVTLNGQIVTPESGRLPLCHEDICSVGARVFAFVLPKDKAK